jgi:hypothetical protein
MPIEPKHSDQVVSTLKKLPQKTRDNVIQTMLSQIMPNLRDLFRIKLWDKFDKYDNTHATNMFHNLKQKAQKQKLHLQGTVKVDSNWNPSIAQDLFRQKNVTCDHYQVIGTNMKLFCNKNQNQSVFSSTMTFPLQKKNPSQGQKQTKRQAQAQAQKIQQHNQSVRQNVPAQAQAQNVPPAPKKT